MATIIAATKVAFGNPRLITGCLWRCQVSLESLVIEISLEVIFVMISSWEMVKEEVQVCYFAKRSVLRKQGKTAFISNF